MTLLWQWEKASRAYGNYGNANQWTVNAGMESLARESAQNTNDARSGSGVPELVYSFIRLTGEHKEEFQQAAQWTSLFEHLDAMAGSANAAVTAGQIKAGVEAMEQADDLVLLQIADYGCRGLTGPEFNDGPEDAYGNFVKLCRLDLFSGKDEAAGGSFGLGKAVYWRFSRLQTVLFNSSLAAGDAVDGKTENRLFGVNAGVIHECGGQRFQGRGYFGVSAGEDVSSTWADAQTAAGLHLNREDTRPGTTALLLGFYDPDEPEGGTSSISALITAAGNLRRGVESNFWPLLTRGGLKVTIRVIDNGDVVEKIAVDPGETYHELTRALRMFDKGQISEDLTKPDAIIVRDIEIPISERRDADKKHGKFVHHAKLVVTMSDDHPDTLENRVCLFRRPEMVVETIDQVFDDTKYHAFLIAGAAINPLSPSEDDLRADDFLRFAEPPAHDRWIPGSGRGQASQSNLTAHYAAPWRPGLSDIQKHVVEQLRSLFGAPPPTTGKAPESILKNLSFLKSSPGTGGTGSVSGLRKPTVEVTSWEVRGGRWHVTFTISARNRDEGWLLAPRLLFVGIDGKGVPVDWESLTAISEAKTDGHKHVAINGKDRGRKLTAVISGVSSADLPIPADEAAVDVIVQEVMAAPAVSDAKSSETNQPQEEDAE